MSTVKSKKLQVGTDASASNNFTIYQPATPDGTLRIGVGNADSPTEVGRFDSNGYVATNAPTFSAYASSAVSLTANVSTKMAMNVEEWDTNSNYDTTNYRFTPTVAGYYQFNGTVQYNNDTDGYLILYKNGSVAKYGYLADNRPSYIATISTMLYCNGTTDYVELYAVSTSTVNSQVGSSLTTFNGFLARAV